ncbi:DUF3572 domain-containing protein [Falsihalocynthiibacter sp. SS001]|uniref:DUF3572 domain-containing protein n=1 Tax=Falsihalocynthiibacter sp. SS001 TaxID=3349698 RepID=UPI0036D270CE
MEQNAAQTVAVRALGWLAGDDELWDVFLGSTGASVADVKSGVGDPAFLGSVLDFLMMDDAWVMRACEGLSLPNETLLRARQALPGGMEYSWT